MEFGEVMKGQLGFGDGGCVKIGFWGCGRHVRHHRR